MTPKEALEQTVVVKVFDHNTDDASISVMSTEKPSDQLALLALGMATIAIELGIPRQHLHDIVDTAIEDTQVGLH